MHSDATLDHFTHEMAYEILLSDFKVVEIEIVFLLKKTASEYNGIQF